MNAVAHMAALLPPAAVRRLAARPVLRFDPVPPVAMRSELDLEQAERQLVARWEDDLCGLLNAMTRDELAAIATAMRIDLVVDRAARAAIKSPALRVALWARGAELERGGGEVPVGLQPRPILLGGHLVVQAPPRGLAPPCVSYPRPVPAAARPAPPAEEPDSVDELLAAADRLIGVRLGPRGRDKGAWGIRAAELLGLIERGHDEPDWRGDIEIKTVPVARERSGSWAVVEDPAIAMVGQGSARAPGVALAKLQRTLWLARATLPADPRDGAPDATIVSWYLLDWDDDVARLARRYLHERPKGPRGTTARGLYLHKRFFADAGLLASLNGWP